MGKAAILADGKESPWPNGDVAAGMEEGGKGNGDDMLLDSCSSLIRYRQTSNNSQADSFGTTDCSL
jgi:hypothetical protein